MCMKHGKHGSTSTLIINYTHRGQLMNRNVLPIQCKFAHKVSSVKLVAGSIDNDATETSNSSQNCNDSSSNDTGPRSPEMPVGDFGLLTMSQKIEGREYVVGPNPRAPMKPNRSAQQAKCEQVRQQGLHSRSCKQAWTCASLLMNA